MSSAADARYFFIIGAMKAGTTSLFQYLSGHPQLCPSTRKEPRVFRDPGDPGQMRQELRKLFTGWSGQPWCYEASTAYAKFPRFTGVPERIREVVPDARFVYLVRNPVERTWSQYVHNLAHGRETRTFEQALAARPQYLDVSRYSLQLRQYLDVFPRERILVLVFEEMIKDPASAVRSVSEFLGIDPSYVPPTKDVVFNASSSKRTATGPLRAVKQLGVEELVPWRMRRWLRARGEELPVQRAGLSPACRASVADALRADTEHFFEVFGRRVAAWKDFA